ncbi:MAG: dihydropteroate synthase [Kiritimatiellae bacterium]|nr:dihydropteroate synthase [Kiritimatiellia bacterium]
MKPALSSLYQAVELRQPIPPLIIGERTNSSGSKIFRERLLENDYQGCLRIGLSQESNGAQVLDLCAAYAGRDERVDMTELVGLFARSVKIPLMIDSTSPDVIEACLKIYPGRCVVNSINLEDGGKTARRVCELLKKYGAATVALTISEKGMAMTADEKLAVARRIYDIAVNEFGLRPADLLFDALTFTVGSGDETLRNAALQTLQAIKAIKTELPGVSTVLGVSNISFGLPAAARKILNSVFLHEAVLAGLDAAIVDAGKIIPFARIDGEDRKACLDLLYDRRSAQKPDPLLSFIAHFENAKVSEAGGTVKKRFEGAEKALSSQVLRGDKEGLADNIAMLLERLPPLDVINLILVPAMREVGELFGRGELLLPFVLQSAEVMKKAVSLLEPLMSKDDDARQTRVLLATVQGDVHDIGKNLVDIILSNNGYKVYNIGIKVPSETIIEKARELKVDVIGLSGLLVKSALVMRDSLRQYREAGLTQPVLLGGAALTPKFVAEDCAPVYGAPVVYCRDAFDGLKAVREHEAGTLCSTEIVSAVSAEVKSAEKFETAVNHDNPVPEVLFEGVRYVEDIDPALLLPHVNRQALFRGRWGYRRGNLSEAEYAKLVDGTVQPIFDKLVAQAVTDNLIRPQVAYGYYRCFSRGDQLLVRDGDREHIFNFPRQTSGERLCLADYFKSEVQGGDVVGMFVGSVGDAIGEAARDLFQADLYHDYLMTHGFGVELTEALAEYWHAVMRRELGIERAIPLLDGAPAKTYQGARYGFGYAACPDLDAQKTVFELLRPERIGVSLTETMQMVPEHTTAAIIVHHPQARYFTV